MKTKRKNVALVTSLAALFATVTAATVLTVTGAPLEKAFADGEFFVSSVTYDTTDIGNWYTCVPTVQGENNFFALYGKAEGMYFEMTADSEQAAGNHWVGGADWDGIWWRQEFAPDAGNDAILAWRAPFNGTVTFQGKVFKESMTDGTSTSDGIILKAYSRKSLNDPTVKELYRHTYTEAFTTYFSGEEITVTSGQIFFFSIDQNGTGAVDTTKLLLKTTFTKNESNPGTESTGGVLPQPDEHPEACIFNNYPNYTLGAQGEYYAAPTARGENNLYALYGKADGFYAEMTADSSSGAGNHWQGSAQYNNIWWRQEFGPDGGDDAILAWRAPFNGKVKFTGKTFKDNMTGSDGVRIKAYNRKSLTADAAEIYNKVFTDLFTVYFNGCEIEVVSGEIYYFAIDQNGTSASDTTKVYLKAEFTKDETTPGTETPVTASIVPEYHGDPSSIFNDEQGYVLGAQSEYYAAPTARGENNLYILYGKANKFYAEMTADSGSGAGNHWQGSAQYNSVWWRQEFAPDGGDDAIIAWRAPFNGKVKFTGKIFKENMTDSDGVRIKAYNRKSLSADATEIYNQMFTEAFTVYFNGCDINVVSGEIYYFAIDQYLTAANDTTKVWLKAEFTKDTENPGTETPVTASIIPEYHGDPSSIFNDEQGYVLGGQSEYYAAPTAQGNNNLWALYGKVDNLYTEMTPNHGTDHAGDHWQGAAGTWNQINWGHDFGPDGGNDAIVAWRAPFNGTVKFTGKIFKDDLTGGNSDGVRIKAYNRKSLEADPVEIYNKAFTKNFTIFFNGCEIEVVSGEIYYFAVDQYLSAAYDTVKVWMKVEFTKDTENPGTEATKEIGAREVDYTGFYGTEQGENNWFYAQGSMDKYALMEYGVNKNTSKLSWNGVDNWHRIEVGNMGPGTNFGAMLIYVVPKDGVVSIMGAVNKTGDGGDGMNAKIYLNGEAIFEHSFGSSPSSAPIPKSLRNLTVHAGDLIVYYADCGGNGDSSYDNLTFACEIFKESETGEAVENPRDYIHPVHKLELQGVNLPEPDLDENEDYTDGDMGCNGSVAFGAGSAAIVAAIALAGVVLKKRKADKGGKQ